MIEIKMIGHEVGIGIDDATGNPMIAALDKQNGIMCTLVIDSQAWKQLLSAAGRLRGVGIPVAGRVVPVAVDGDLLRGNGGVGGG